MWCPIVERVQSGEGVKADGFIAFGLHRQGLAGRPSGEGTPDLPFAGLQSALGSLRERRPILR